MKSSVIKDGVSTAPQRSLLNALGLTEEEIKKPFIGIVSSKNDIVPGHMNIDKIVDAVKQGVALAGGVPIVFPAIAVCDGIAMGHEGMKYSLVTRELIADSTEAMAKAHAFDALVMVPNCDKNVPGMLMAAARINVPTVFVSGGPMLAGHVKGKKTSLSSMFEAVGAYAAGKMTEEDVKEYCHRIYDDKTKTYHAECCKIEDKWMMNKVDKLVAEVTKNIENYDLGIALDKIYSFIWNEFCDWYIEMVKPRLYGEDYTSKVIAVDILNHALETALKLLHPFMPFVTTEVFSNLIQYGKHDLMVADWPNVRSKFAFDEEEQTVEKIKEIITEIRNVRANMNIHPSKKSELIFVTQKYENEIWEAKDFILKLGLGEKIIVQKDKAGILENAISILKDGIELYMPLEDLVDMEEERKRLEEEKTRLESEVARCEKMLSNPGFVNKAPEKKIQEEKDKLEKYKEMLAKVEQRLK